MKMETMMEEGEEEYLNQEESWNYELDVSQLCRICANPNEYLIPIFHGEGLEHELKSKISKHLPIKILEDDKLPTQLCYQCASTLIAWHDMVVGCLEADEKLRALFPDDKIEIDIPEVIGHNNMEECTVEVENNKMKSTPVQHMIKITTESDVENVVQELQISPTIDTEKVALEEEVTSVEPELIEEVSPDTRYVEPFSAYHQTQIALKMHHLVSNGSVFCMLCGKMKQNQSLLIKHLSIEHKIRCGHCHATFANEDQLSAHMLLHGNNKISMKCDNVYKAKQSGNEGCLNCGICDKRCKRNLHLKLGGTKQLPEFQVYSQSLTVKSPPFQCDICSALFSRRFDLKRHKIKHHSGQNLHLTDKENGSNNVLGIKKVDVMISNKKYSNNFEENYKSDVDDEINNLDCSDDSVNSEDISRHLDIRTKTSQIMANIKSGEQNYSCSFCDYTCRKKLEMLAHRRKSHTIQERKRDAFESNLPKSRVSKNFSCSLCKNSYSRSSDLQRHIIKKHGGEKFIGRCIDSVDDMNVEIVNRAKQNINGVVVYHCDICDKNMLTKRGYVRHVRIHTGERPFTCHVCGKQYRSNTDLTRHLRCVHDGVKNYQCDICGRYFANKGTRNDHRRIHTGEKPFVCHICGKSFPTPNSIYVHRRIHTDYFPHQCTTCDKKFRRKQQLIHHMRTHTGEKPHACDICGKCFAVKDEVSRHRLTHSNEKPYVCPVCGICFGQKRYLSNHLKTHHSRMV